MKLSGIQMHYFSLIIDFLQPLIIHRTNNCSHSVTNRQIAGHTQQASTIPALQLSHTAQRPYHILPA